MLVQAAGAVVCGALIGSCLYHLSWKFVSFPEEPIVNKTVLVRCFRLCARPSSSTPVDYWRQLRTRAGDGQSTWKARSTSHFGV